MGLRCWWSGHDPLGPLFNAAFADFAPKRATRTERETYLCRRCDQRIRFCLEHPNGWIVVYPVEPPHDRIAS